MHTEHFSLTANAFWVLKADYKSNTTEISDLVDDAEFDENFSQDLIQRSQQALLSPIARLDQELSWLPELSSNQTEEISSLLASNELNKLVGAVDFLPDLPKANVLAHLCGTNSIEEKVLQNLLQAWDDIREIDLLSFVNSERQIAGFPKVEMAQLENAVKAIGSKHARNAAMAVWKFNAPGKLMETLVEEELRRGSTSSILAQFVREYDNLSEPKLVQISDSIEGKIKQVSEPRCDLEGVVDEISDLLRQWDDVNQAVQVFEQHQGHEEGRSKRIYEKVRELCLELANDRSEFLQAKRLSEALLHTFPELESVAEVLRGDVETLESLDEQKRQFAVVEPLVAACETAKQKLRKLKLELQKTGFKQARGGLLHEIFVAFENAAKSPEARDAAFLIVRDLALFANNERDDPETAFRLIDGLLTYRSMDLSRNCSAPLTWYFATKESHHGTETNPGIPRRGSARSVDERLAS
ncbi:hypothetical protein [Roseovarius confluentis]|uniref:hypothetical protein n=1 Tax=Roseovarius confluentis TaxID=1852027 RepID=UPI003BAC921A